MAVFLTGTCIICGQEMEVSGTEAKKVPCDNPECDATVRVFRKPWSDNVEEIPVGKYDAVRTLRMCLQMAERGEFNRAMVVVQKVPNGEIKDTEGAPEVFYSEMPRWEALWLVRFLNSFADHRFFGKFHGDDDE